MYKYPKGGNQTSQIDVNNVESLIKIQKFILCIHFCTSIVNHECMFVLLFLYVLVTGIFSLMTLGVQQYLQLKHFEKMTILR